MRVFFDTNVLVSAFLARGLCADLLRLVLTEHTLVTSEVVLAELRDVLSRKGRLPAQQIDAIETFLPEWEQIRLLPHASAIHRFTVDRHVVETCAEAGALIRTVRRPDLLLVAALLHRVKFPESA